ncbi:MAG: hypothetical protein V4591_10180 [Bdellovibrionota bacterium]
MFEKKPTKVPKKHANIIAVLFILIFFLSLPYYLISLMSVFQFFSDDHSHDFWKEPALFIGALSPVVFFIFLAFLYRYTTKIAYFILFLYFIYNLIVNLLFFPGIYFIYSIFKALN